MQRYTIFLIKRLRKYFFCAFYKKKGYFFCWFKKKQYLCRRKFEICHKRVGYGVMVTLQILVLPFLVRVRVPQHLEIPTTCKSGGWIFLLSKLSSNYRSISENSIFEKIGDAIIISITAPHGFIKNRH